MHDWNIVILGTIIGLAVAAAVELYRWIIK